MLDDLKALMVGIAAVVTEHTNEVRKEFDDARAADAIKFSKAMQERDERIDALTRSLAEKAALSDVPNDWRNWQTWTMQRIEVAIATLMCNKPADGKDATDEQVRAAVGELFAKAESVHADRIEALVSQTVQDQVAALPPAKSGEDGRTPTHEELRAAFADDIAEMQAIGFSNIEKMGREFVSTIPMPKDGRTPTDEEIAAAIEGSLASIDSGLHEKLDKWVANVQFPKDGVTPTDADVDRAVERVAARWQLELERRASDKYDKFIDALPKAKDGIDGLGFDDVKVEYDNERTLDIVFERDGAERRFTMKLPVPIYREVFKPGTKYAHHDQVTYAGSTWHAMRDTAARPGEGNEDWRLVVKRGRDGKDFDRALTVGKGSK